MATQLQIVNNVLRELREDQITSVVDTTYAQLIGTFVNRAIEWMEDANHQWSVYITEISTTVLADGSTVEYDLSATNDRSVLMRSLDYSVVPQAYDVTSNQVGQLQDFPYSHVLRERALTNDTSKTVVIPRGFAVRSDSDGRGYTLHTIWPVASTESARTWKTYWYIPQTKLVLTGGDDSTVVKLPAAPLELYALYLSLNERGEEMGQPGSIISSTAQQALGSALERDRQVQMKGTHVGADDWTNTESL